MARTPCLAWLEPRGLRGSNPVPCGSNPVLAWLEPRACVARTPCLPLLGSVESGDNLSSLPHLSVARTPSLPSFGLARHCQAGAFDSHKAAVDREADQEANLHQLT